MCIDFANAEEAHLELIWRGFVIDYRPGGGIRGSPHFYNTKEECNAIIDQMKQLCTD